MSDIKNNPQPALIVVTGRPGAGKSTLTHALATAIRCPAICRDAIKEGLVNTAGQPGGAGDDIQRQAFEAFFETVNLLLTHRITLIAEAAFQHKLWAPKLEKLAQIAQVRILVCDIDPRLARSRRIERGVADPQRQRFHPDSAVPDEYDPPHLDLPTLKVDTSDGYRPDFETLLAFARGRAV